MNCIFCKIRDREIPKEFTYEDKDIMVFPDINPLRSTHLLIVPKEHVVWVTANMSAPPANGKVFEGWFVDDGGSGYKLSLGEFAKNGTLTFKERMVNPYTYTQFIVTEEPFEDADPNAAAASGGTQLQTPFGR